MIDIHNKALQKTITVDRIIKKIEGYSKGPVVVFFSGIHGNETAGVFALYSVLNKINPEDVNGTIYGLTGNIKALKENHRYLKQDLNRIWTVENLEVLESKTKLNPEEEEQVKLFSIIKDIISSYVGPFYFMDLHTTSSRTLPFITINDSIINRKFSQLFPVPIVLGIEEYLNGPLLSYINTLGYVSLGFESGQHEDEHAITCAIAFIYLVLGYINAIPQEKIRDFEVYYNLLKLESLNITDVYEVVHLHSIINGEKFKMYPNFNSFQNVKKGTALAVSNGEELVAERDSVVFMPLYQKRGKDGYFLIRKIKPFFLNLSSVLRRIKADSLLAILPGVSWDTKEKNALVVNLKVAKYLAKPMFHLLGYRNKRLDKTHLKIYNRERISKRKIYRKEKWWFKFSPN
ncbi:MAG: aspartoacylase [Flavobacteriaceae bacterium]|nr:succinylglutamate desuccinylase/aspartoacylase family protein [Bacteroidia bacterium]NNK82280.1 aspartoacylase [Flavobacteriaceae bacterium]